VLAGEVTVRRKESVCKGQTEMLVWSESHSEILWRKLQWTESHSEALWRKKRGIIWSWNL